MEALLESLMTVVPLPAVGLIFLCFNLVYGWPVFVSLWPQTGNL